ncbi:type II toxin-antitoxin system RelB/DinJ family antitoxin [Lactobacillus sp. DCY120]|uniref:Type II toxin-antitoxin system RelB/DinJ family antitoxin n=1 Tax=Bombilactobacillus apium TaxID=2675299 RepID=A0A850QXI2_9LACO|nr:type II toxin-antitoxin system RelB/DinJ family antitoxin [Bombilactobacillus apium]NVY96524.1 type II toxin-antitoxin system RelB/DinJ family antitoxin [Bombilactobacillus apium]
MEVKNKTVRISARIDPETKTAAQEALSTMGLDMSTAISIFLKQVARDQRLPFTPDAKDPLDRATDIALQDVKAGRVTTFNSLADFRKDLYSNED